MNLRRSSFGSTRQGALAAALLPFFGLVACSGGGDDSSGSGSGGGGNTSVGGASDGAYAGGNSASASGGGSSTANVPVDDSLFSVSVQLASDVEASAPGTIGIVEWSLSQGQVTAASIEFGLDTSYGMTAPVDLAEAGYRTLLLGMKPNRDYHFRIVATTDSGSVASGDYTLSTGPATNLVTLSSFDVVDDAARERGFIISELFQSGMGGGGMQSAGSGSVVFIIDADGEIVWWYQSSLGSLARARMSADGKNMWIAISGLDGGPLERVSMDTLDAQTYDVSASHDLTAVSGDTMAFLEYGESDCDSIFEIDPSGVTREIFESSDVLSGQCHGNALRYSASEDVYTFSDHQTDVFVVQRDGSLSWRLSDRVGSNSTWGGAQHGHQLLDDGILIFANNGGGNNSAAALEYDLSGNEISRYDPGIPTSNLGDVQRLPGGNTLVTFSTSAIIHEITPQGSAVLTIETGSAVGYSMWRDSLYGPPPDLSM